MTPSDRSQLTMTDDIMLTDGGLETVLVFHEGIDLPAFAAFPLLDQGSGRDCLRRYFTELPDAGGGHEGQASSWRPRRGAPTSTGAPSWGTQPTT